MFPTLRAEARAGCARAEEEGRKKVRKLRTFSEIGYPPFAMECNLNEEGKERFSRRRRIFEKRVSEQFSLKLVHLRGDSSRARSVSWKIFVFSYLRRSNDSNEGVKMPRGQPKAFLFFFLESM